MTDFSEKIILTDVDGVLLSWISSFDEFMLDIMGVKAINLETYDARERYNVDADKIGILIKAFEQSIHMSQLAPHLDAVKYVRKLHEEHGYKFITATSVSNSWIVYNSRVKNLTDVFGNVFSDYWHAGFGGSKIPFFEKYQDTEMWFIDDHPTHYNEANKHGLNALLMDSHHNKSYHHLDRVMDWKEVYERIVG